jgi:hypothetical protein
LVIPAVGRDGGDEVLPFDQIVAGNSPTAAEPDAEEDETGGEGLDEEEQELLELLEALEEEL